jgi:hypothetical protein
MATTEEISSAPPCVGERYAGAVSTSNLTAPPEFRPTDAYVLVASGLGRKSIGGWLMRLQTEWERTAKPQRAKPPTVAEYLAKLPLIVTGKEKVTIKVKGEDGKETTQEVERSVRGPDVEKAKRLHEEAVAAIPQWHDAEIRMLKNRMRDMPQVRDHLCTWLYGEAFVKLRDELAAFPDRKAAHPDFADAEKMVAETILYWLDDTCQTCHGKRWQLVPNTNRLSNRKCPACHGTGIQREPKSMTRLLMLDYMRQCVFDWRQSCSDHLSTMSGRGKAKK